MVRTPAVTGYLSYAEQAAHYFDRAHTAPILEPIDGPAAWRGPEVAAAGDGRTVLGPQQVAEIESALDACEAAGKPLADLGRGDLPLPGLAADIAAWRDELATGRGFQVVSGVPVERWTRARAERFFWCLGLLLGRPGAQNPQGDLLGHVRDTGDAADDPFVRLYRTSADIAYHCDAADVVGLLCLQPAIRGGTSRIVSSVAVYNELLRRRPELVPRLFEPFALDVRNEDASGALRHLPIPPCRAAAGRLRTFYHSDYFRSALRHDDVPRFTADEQELLDLYEEIAASPDLYLDMELAAGDIQWLSNHTVLHARTAYTDAEDPACKRHLLRLWLSL